MADKLKIIIGSTRPGRAGPTIARWAYDQAVVHGRFDVELLDLADFDLPLMDEPRHPRLRHYEHEHTRRWSEAVGSADAFLFVAPEYDYFPSAALVNALQYLSQEWHYKTATVVSYGGVSGGLRATQELRQLLGNLNMMPIPQTVPIPFFPKFITEEKIFVPDAPVVEGLKLALDELAKWSAALKPLRAG